MENVTVDTEKKKKMKRQSSVEAFQRYLDSRQIDLFRNSMHCFWLSSLGISEFGRELGRVVSGEIVKRIAFSQGKLSFNPSLNEVKVTDLLDRPPCSANPRCTHLILQLFVWKGV